MGFGNKELLILGLISILGKCLSDCDVGFLKKKKDCVDDDECQNSLESCGEHADCFNTNGSFYCQCKRGFTNINKKVNFTLRDGGQCQDDNECITQTHNCSLVASCENLIGGFKCTCHSGYTKSSNETEECADIDECEEAEMNREDICGKEGICKNTPGSYWCRCPEGYTNYDNKTTPCSELKCDTFNAVSGPAQSLGGLANILSMMRNSCLALSNPSAAGEGKAHGEVLLENFFTATVAVLSPGHLKSGKHVSMLLDTMENSIMLIGPQLKDNLTKMDTTEIDAVIAVQKGKTRPTGHIHLTSENSILNTDWETATGPGTYPGFALAALLSYKNLNITVDGSFQELNESKKDGVDPSSIKVFSRVVTVVVSNPSTQHLSRFVNITLRHLEDTPLDTEEPSEVKYICAYWNERGVWSTDGCYQQSSNDSHTVCTCEHLSSFAVLMALYPMEHTFGLRLVSKIGLIVSVLCLILSILTFKFCRSIQGTRTTIHLHLCICLLVADVVFLVGISQTKPVAGCRFVAAMLHYFFLGVFTWMLLEGVQLYRMVVLVFNATIRPLYLFVAGYVTPLVIVIISAISRPQRYGTDQYCWLSTEDGFIWSFFGPVCFIIILNVYFFIITVWKLAQKFTSLNPDLSELHKIKAFTVTAVAQMCILGLMWVFGAFQFTNTTTVNIKIAYIFTILNSLQGALVFILHCLLSKQVREEYAHFLSCICTSQKKRYTDLSTTNASSSQSQASRSGDHTKESQI
ncbi:adhesion G protein-coupled receptor E1-like [Seriola aureovittata]|uniref:adhesion G protein-coupled receptor E1-like n=1 Tax=Seriola aureovittata TaxID=2871759 RepID=UPI0024BE9B2C|nr:adhesion G protein-coupled receptor E1-like [Seriola aureovittata]